MAARPLILLVEDNQMLRDAFTRALGMMGCEVTAAVNPVEALPLLAAGLRPSLILSDLEMPDMPGDEFCAIVRVKYPEIPVVLVSGHAGVYARGHAAGATRTYMKPISRELLGMLIRELA